VKPNDIDTLVNALTRRSSPQFKSVEIPHGAVPLQQISSNINYVCIHSYASPPVALGGLSQEVDEDMNYLCVTLISKYAVSTPDCSKCFVRSAKVTSWMTKSGINRKKVIICRFASM
jgi:hypothetical protein